MILGATGSIGCQTLDVVRSHPDRFEVVGLACNSSCDRLVQQITEFDVPAACLRDASGAIATWPASCERLPYPEGLEQLAARDDVDIVVVATVGDVGFRPTEAALRAGNTVALASKELLVMGGQLFRDLANSTGTQILPIDSEHSALWQCLAGEAAGTVRRLILTASGGPFRETDAATVRDATAEQALKTPELGYGAQDHHRLSQPDEQGSRGHRGALAVRHSLRPHRGDRSSQNQSCTPWWNSMTAR